VDDLFSVAGKSVLITGGSSGIGLQMVRLFVARGAKVSSVATHHDPKTGSELNARERLGAPVCFIEANLREDADVRRAFDEASAAHGVPEILINNAGVSLRRRVMDVTRDEWSGVMDINLKAMFFVAQEAARRMMAAKISGTIINMTSILGQRAMTGTAVYSASKAALSQMTKALAFELTGYGIRVNAIAPGWFETRMTSEFLNGGAKAFLKSVNPMRRLGEDGDLDGAALLLASNAGRYMTGTIITVDGGQSLSG
jgi:2-dehydro-3-deoxy-D-gluconate 5-dehydrogenase